MSVSVSVSVHPPAPDGTHAIWLDLASDLSCTNNTRPHWVDAEHQPTDLVVVLAVAGGPQARPDRAGVVNSPPPSRGIALAGATTAGRSRHGRGPARPAREQQPRRAARPPTDRTPGRPHP